MCYKAHTGVYGNSVIQYILSLNDTQIASWLVFHVAHTTLFTHAMSSKLSTNCDECINCKTGNQRYCNTQQFHH